MRLRRSKAARWNREIIENGSNEGDTIMWKMMPRRWQFQLALTALIVFCAVRQVLNQNFENVFLCILSLILLNIPSFLEKRLGIRLPGTLAVVIMLFIFCAEILGEINAYYVKFPIWDTLLHTTNGFLMAAIGFSLVDLFNRSDRFLVKLSPQFVAVFAFCFSMTIGILWEFFECGADLLVHTDMQKDTIVTAIHSVALNQNGENVPIHVTIQSLVVNGEDWMEKYGGYLDIGLLDTMKDLFVNFIGAVVFSVIGYFYVKQRGKGRFARRFIPMVFRGDNLDNFGNPLGQEESLNDEVQVFLAKKEWEQVLAERERQKKLKAK